MVLEGKVLQYPVNAGVSFIVGPTLFLQQINDFSDDDVCNVAIYTDDKTLYSIIDQASDMWYQLKLAFKLESDLQDTQDWGKNRFVDLENSDRKTQLD